MHEWILVDLVGKKWQLDELGTLSPDQKKTIKRNNKPMALNNRGDTIKLVDHEGNVVQIVTYKKVTEGEFVYPNTN